MSAPPQNPNLAPNGWGLLHGDSYMSNTVSWNGPTGRLQVGKTLISEAAVATANTLLFLPDNQMVTVLYELEAGGGVTSALLLLDQSLDSLDSVPLSGGLAGSWGAAYFVLDSSYNILVPGESNQILVFRAQNGTLVQESAIQTQGLTWPLSSLIPAWGGGISYSSSGVSRSSLWLVTTKGEIAYYDALSGSTPFFPLNQEVRTASPLDENNSLYVAGSSVLVCCTFQNGSVSPLWQSNLPNGTKTTPALNSTSLILVDEATPPNVLVFDRSTGSLSASIPVFADQGPALVQVTPIVFGSAAVVSNAANYVPYSSTLSSPGLVAVDSASGSVSWENSALNIPSTVSRLSAANGMIYTYGYPAGNKVWSFFLLNDRGTLVARAPVGSSSEYDNFYAALVLSPWGVLYQPAGRYILSARGG